MSDDDLNRIIDTEWGRRPSGLRLAYHAVDHAGVTQQVWGIEIHGDLPLNPVTLRKEFARLPWPNTDSKDLPEVEVLRVENRSAVQEIATFVVEALPSALIGAAVAEGLRAVAKKLQPWSKPKSNWGDGPNPLGTPEEILAYATRRATEIAYDTCRDIVDEPWEIMVLSTFMPPLNDVGEAAPTIVLRTSDGEHFTIQLWISEGHELHTVTRSR